MYVVGTWIDSIKRVVLAGLTAIRSSFSNQKLTAHITTTSSLGATEMVRLVLVVDVARVLLAVAALIHLYFTM